MSYAQALLLTLFTAIVSVIATSLVRRALGVDTRREHHEVGNPVYLQIGVVFAVLLAFVFNEVFGEYNAEAQSHKRRMRRTAWRRTASASASGQTRTRR